jgi:hypothetical protein
MRRNVQVDLMFEVDDAIHPLNNEEFTIFAKDHEELFHHWQLSMQRYSIPPLSLLILKIDNRLFSAELLREYLLRYATDITDINEI